MSQSAPNAVDPADLTDEELLVRIAALDPERYPLAAHASRALDRD